MIKPMLCALIVIPAVTLMSAQAQALSLCCVPAVPPLEPAQNAAGCGLITTYWRTAYCTQTNNEGSKCIMHPATVEDALWIFENTPNGACRLLAKGSGGDHQISTCSLGTLKEPGKVCPG